MNFPDPTFRLKVIPDFYYRAHEVRSRFVEFFSDPYRHGRERFAVDYWYVPDSYCYLRIHTEDVLGQALADDFHGYLRVYARTHLGLDNLSGTFLSVYVNGMFQRCHSDMLNGTYAFVYSLTDWENRRFSGGETQVARDGAFDRDLPRDHKGPASFWESVPNHFNSLTLFDDRYPHQVPVVQGQMDPLLGRAVIHGHLS